MKKVLPLMLLAVAPAVFAADVRFVATMQLLDEKANACIRSGRQSSEYCRDFRGFSDFIFKDDTRVWVMKEVDAGNITDANIDQIKAMLVKNAHAYSVP